MLHKFLLLLPVPELTRPLYRRLIPYLLLFWAVLLAWMPLIFPYIPVADDYPLSANLGAAMAGSSQHILANQGMWRILGMLLCGLIVKLGGYTAPVLIVMTHAIVVSLFYAVTLRLWKHATLSLII